jgi:ATP-dependent Lon protease
MAENPNIIHPLLPLRDIVLFPGMVVPLVVGREKSVLALERAMQDETLIFLVAQREATIEEPTQKDLFTMGTLGKVMQLLRLPEGTVKALVEGKQRARLVGVFDALASEHSCPYARLMEVADTDTDSKDLPAFIRELRRVYESYCQVNRKIPREVLQSILEQSDAVRMVDTICAHLPIITREKQELLETLSVPQRMRMVLELLHREMELMALERDINAKVKKKMSDVQRNFYLAEKVRAIHEEMGQGEGGDDMAELEEAIAKKNLPEVVRKRAEKEFRKLRQMPPMSAETTVVRNYLDAILNLPWRKKSRSRIDINRAEDILNEDHYGLDKPKERILDHLAVQAQVKKVKGPILCLVGPPGVGKTSVCKSIARSIGRRFVRISLGGVHDEAEIRGHRRTYIGAMPGKIILAMQRAEVINPVFCLDEIDKMSSDFRGDPASALLEVLDPEQNNTFNDHYLDLDYDLSQVLFITTANHLHGIPAPLQDRMEIIELRGYTEEEKLHIATDFLLPKQLKANGFGKDDITLPDETLLTIIRSYTREAGVRNLERAIGTICRKVARDRLKSGKLKKQYTVSSAIIGEYLGVAKYRFGLAEEEDKVGLATGMAWTEMGGELLQIEASVMPGTGKLVITGKLGEVMQESAQAALSYVRSHFTRFGLDADSYQKIDVHVHVPEGAIPKDGPSAGITIATAIVSAMLRIPVRCNIAMSGEITLRGRILPVGGLTEKLLAARRGNITHVLLPRENERNLHDVPANIKDSLHIDLVDDVDEVLQRALVVGEGESLFKDAPIDPLYADYPLVGRNTNASIS